MNKLNKLLGLALAGALQLGAAQAEPVSLTYVGFVAAGTGSALPADWWMDEIEQRTAGEVKFRRFHGGQLCKGVDIVECVRDGRADVGSTPSMYTPSYFPINALDGLPYVATDMRAVPKAFDRLYKEVPEFRAEHERIGLRLQYTWPADPMMLGASKPINSLEDIKSEAVRATGTGPIALVEALGGNPIAISSSEQYEALNSRLIAGFTNSFDGATSNKLYEVAPYWYDPGFGVYASVGMWISQAAWDRLSPEAQKVVQEVNEEMVAGRAVELYIQPLKKACETLKASGRLQTFEQFDAETMAQIKTQIGNRGYDIWEASVLKAGVKEPKAIFDTYAAAIAEFSGEALSPMEECMNMMKQ